jgi:methionyl-tRNA formyltransferase
VRVLFFGNNALAARVAEYLRAQGDEIAGLVLHPEVKRRGGDEIRRAAGAADVYDGSRLAEPDTLRALAGLRAEIGVSVLFGYLLRPQVLELLPKGCVNLHPGYLPWNRGAYPNVWSIVDRTPAGATLHYVDEGIDTGDIVSQRQVEVLPTDTGASLYRRLEEACHAVFVEAWPRLRDGSAPRIPQRGEGSFHRVRDVEKIDEIDPERAYRAGELIDILRARTFPPYSGAYIRRGSRKVTLRVDLGEEAL